MITIRYFARLREGLGLSDERLELPAGIDTAGALREWLCQRGNRWRDHLDSPSLLIAVNQDLTGPDREISDGDEVAFFPPVTGG